MTDVKILSPRELREMTSLSQVTVWRLERDGLFPQRLHLTNGRVGWPVDEVKAWLESRPRGINAKGARAPTLA